MAFYCEERPSHFPVLFSWCVAPNIPCWSMDSESDEKKNNKNNMNNNWSFRSTLQGLIFIQGQAHVKSFLCPSITRARLLPLGCETWRAPWCGLNTAVFSERFTLARRRIDNCTNHTRPSLQLYLADRQVMENIQILYFE